MAQNAYEECDSFLCSSCNIARFDIPLRKRIGSGDSYNVYGVNGFLLTAGDKDYKERLEQIEEGVKEYYNANGIPPGEPTMKGSNADPYVADVALPNAELGDYSVPTDWPTNVKFNEPGDVPGPVVQFEDDDQGDVKAGYGFESDNLYEGDWFFFHTDHLGSTSYLTDTAGNVSQFVCYTPYGEAIVDELLTTYENPFKFCGKELDDITGLYDHGARSRNPVSTLWYGIDPLWEKFTDFSPYNYCEANPIILSDPNGCAGNNRTGVPARQKKDGTFTTAQSSTYVPSPIPERTSSKKYDQQYGDPTFGSSNHQEGVETTSSEHGPGIDRDPTFPSADSDNWLYALQWIVDKVRSSRSGSENNGKDNPQKKEEPKSSQQQGQSKRDTTRTVIEQEYIPIDNSVIFGPQYVDSTIVEEIRENDKVIKRDTIVKKIQPARNEKDIYILYSMLHNILY